MHQVGRNQHAIAAQLTFDGGLTVVIMEPVDRCLVQQTLDTENQVDDLHSECVKHRQTVESLDKLFASLLIDSRHSGCG